MLDEPGLNILQTLASLGIVIALMLLAAAAFRHFSGGAFQMQAPGRKKRLSVAETRLIDHRSKLVLVRRDAVEHLILITPGGTTIIESDIPAAPETATTEGKQP